MFSLKKVHFLAHVISADGIMVDPVKVKSILEWNLPKNVSKVCKFLGLVGYCRRLVKGFSMIASPLTQLLKKKENFVWSDDCQHSFKKLKAILTEALVLAQPEPRVEYMVYIDASLDGLGCVLIQKGKVMAYASR